MKQKTLTNDLNAVCIDPKTEVLVIQFKRKLTEQASKVISRTLNAWSKKNGVSCLLLTEPTKLSIVQKSEFELEDLKDSHEQ